MVYPFCVFLVCPILHMHSWLIRKVFPCLLSCLLYIVVKMLHKLKTPTFWLCRKKNFIKQEISLNTRGSARVSLRHCTLVKAAHTSGLTHHTLVSCEAFTNAQLHMSASVRRGNDRRCRASITRIVCSHTNIQYKIQKINKTPIVGWTSGKELMML